MEPTFLDDLVRTRRVIVCCGAGGVGKTTTAAALGLAAARAGRRAIVLTIDPARRLAEAMGISPESCNAPSVVPAERLTAAGMTCAGEMSVWMPAPHEVLDGLVRKLAASEEHRQRIVCSRLYRHFSEMVIGLQEYTAGEALHMVTADGRYDLVVLDTPPSRNALDFLEAPRKLAVLLDEKVIGLFLPQSHGTRLWGGVVKLIQKVFVGVFGQTLFSELQELLLALSHMFHDIRVHAEEVRTLLMSPEAAFILVSSSDPSALAEAEFFRGRLVDLGLPVRGYVLNRSWAFTRGLGCPGDIALPIDSPASLRVAHEKLVHLAETERRWADRDRSLLVRLREQAEGVHAIATPHIGEAIESLQGLIALAQNLVLPSAGLWEHEPASG